MRNRNKLLLVFLLLHLLTEKINAQLNFEKSYSYGIWISEYQKDWIDAENSYWLIESPKEFENIDTNILEISYLCIDSDLTSQLCCNDPKFDNVKGLTHSANLWDVSALFDSKKTKKFRVGNTAIQIIKLDQRNCKCSGEFASYCNTGLSKTSSIISYRYIELTKEEKKNFRKSKECLIEYLNKNNI
ncbi:MAG TPA: hypothetical protein VKN14_14330 [Flavobacteriaceae bacterium]|nr:hypothetical protein [Flavobacteriaceae bacterium]